jgi:hypothetical protein
MIQFFAPISTGRDYHHLGASCLQLVSMLRETAWVWYRELALKANNLDFGLKKRKMGDVVPCDPRGRGGYVAVGHCKICRTQDTGTVAAHTVNRVRLSKRSETLTTSVRGALSRPDLQYVASALFLKPVKV